jgi:hypothetical protein
MLKALGRVDKRPEMIAWRLRVWCHFSPMNTTYIESDGFWENPSVEFSKVACATSASP